MESCLVPVLTRSAGLKYIYLVGVPRLVSFFPFSTFFCNFFSAAASDPILGPVSAFVRFKTGWSLSPAAASLADFRFFDRPGGELGKCHLSRVPTSHPPITTNATT